MPRPLPVGLAGRIHRLDRLVLAYHPPQFLPRARVGLSNRVKPCRDGRPKRRDLRAGADQLWIELGINRLADAGTAANDALAASITAMRTSSLSTSTTHGLGELIAVVRECADAAATAGRLGRPHPPS